MKIRFSSLVFLLLIYIPFETLILKYLPVSDDTYTYLRYAFEIYIYILFLSVIVLRISRNKLPVSTPIDFPLIIFIGLAFINTWIQGSSFTDSIIGMKSTFRFVLIFYIIVNTGFSASSVKWALLAVIFIAGIQAVLSFQQHFYGIDSFWIPRPTTLQVGSRVYNFKIVTQGDAGGLEQGAVIGTFGDSALLGNFLVIAVMLIVPFLFGLYRMNIFWKAVLLLLYILCVISLFFTYSRGSAVIGVLIIPFMMYISGKHKQLLKSALIFCLLILPIVLFYTSDYFKHGGYFNPKFKYVDPLSNVATLFTPEYANNTLQHSRGWVILNIGGNLLHSFTPLGYSADAEFALTKIFDKQLGVTSPFKNYFIVNDVYWISFIAYYGFLGLGIFLYILFRLFFIARFVWRNTKEQIFKVVAVSTMTLLIVSVPYSFIIATFTFRSFGIYFWFLAGITMLEYRRIKESTAIIPVK